MAVNFNQAEYAGLAALPGQCPQDGLPEVVLSGRSNVGKSSMVNALLGQRKIARTSKTPGKTRQIVFFRVNRRFYLVDLPGYGHAAVARQARQAFSQLTDDYLGSGRPIALILLLLDIRISPTADDIQMMHWLEHSGYAWRMVLTKSDKLSRSACLARRRSIAAELDLADEEELVIFSGQTAAGADTLRHLIELALP